MILKNPTPSELLYLRRVTSMPNSKIRYLVMRFLPKNVLQLFAYAYDKHTPVGWKRILGTIRIEHIVQPPRETMTHTIKLCTGFQYNESTKAYTQLPGKHVEEYGSLESRRVQTSFLIPVAPKPPAMPMTSSAASTQATEAYAMAMRDHSTHLIP
jgi:hypothetical protein